MVTAAETSSELIIFDFIIDSTFLFHIKTAGTDPNDTHRPGILLATRLLVSRAGAPQGPISPTYQQAGAKMKKKRESFRCFLLLLFLAGEKKVEIRHGVVVAFDFVDETLLRPLAHGHCGRLSSSMSSSRRVHYSLICESAHFDSKRTDNDLATRVGTPRIHQRGASSPMPERWYI